MSYIITAEETHPDRLTTAVYGPYEDEDKAYADAKAMEDSPHNIIPGYNTKRNWYYVTELTNPEGFNPWSI